MADLHAKPRLSDAVAALERKAAAAEPPRDLFARVSERVERRRNGRMRRNLALATVSLAAAAAAGVWVMRPSLVNGFEVQRESSGLRWQARADGALDVTAGKGTLRVSALTMRISVEGGSRVRREPSGVRMLAGHAIFDVESRRDRGPVRVLVSHGAIEVVGTRFTVVQAEGGGSVTLADGVVRFVAGDRPPITMRPGETLRWPIEERAGHEAPPAKAPEARKPGPRTSRLSAATEPLSPAAGKLLRELEELRIRHAYEHLEKRLDEALASSQPEPLRERLSFERCDLLAQQGTDAARACQRITEHLRRYPASEYTPQLEKMRADKRCR